jgi:hypothetical protein
MKTALEKAMPYLWALAWLTLAAYLAFAVWSGTALYP